MIETLGAIGFVLALWWGSTSLAFVLNGLPRATFRWSMVGASIAAGLALYVLVRTRNDSSNVAAYIAFSAALMVWGWNELALLLGFVTGPRKTACPEDARGGRRFRYAFQAILDHELAILASLVVIVGLTWDAPNRVGAYTFGLLWVMRISAKLNLFLGVRNVGAELLPPHLTYLGSYFKRSPMNPLMPISIVGSALITLWLAQLAGGAGGDGATPAGFALLATLAGLALLEHCFLVLPIRTDALWRWSMSRRRHA